MSRFEQVLDNSKLGASWCKVGQISACLLSYWVDFFRERRRWINMMGTVLIDGGTKLLPFQFLPSNIFGLKKLRILDDGDDQISVNWGCGLNNELFGEGEKRVNFILSFSFATPSRWT